MAITYNAGTDTITVTGYTEAVPCTFNDIALADMAGAWGQVSWSYGFRYAINCKLTIGDGTTATWFADENQQIIIPSGIVTGGGWGVWCNKKANANIRLGKCTNSTKKIVKNGCQIWITRDATGGLTVIDGENSSGQIEIYASQIYLGQTGCQARFYRCQNGKFWGNNFDINTQIANATGVDVYNINYFNSHSCLASVTGTFDLIRIYKTVYVTNIDQNTVANVTLTNLVVKENTYVARGYNTARNIYLIDCDIENWTFSYSSYSGRFYRQYTLNIKVIEEDSGRTPIGGATVKIWDLGGNLVTTALTYASGKILQQTLNFGYYNQAGGDTPVMQTPHKIEISKPGYETFVKYMYMDYQRKEVIMLRKTRPVKLCDDRLVLQICSETEKEDRFIYTELV